MAPLTGRAGRVAAPVCAVLLALLALPALAATPRLTPLEMAVKASYLTKFGPFVEWPPPGATTEADTAMRLCIVGKDPFGEALDRAVQGQRIGGRPLTIVRLGAVDRGGASTCQIMFVGAPTMQPTAETLAAAAGLPVLTVTDPERGVRGGIIQFVLERGRVRFEIDQQKTADSGLSISAKLLDLAVKVKKP